MTESGAHVRQGEPKLCKADKKLLKKIKRRARESRDAVMEALEVVVKAETPAPVRCLTPEAREDRAAFEQHYLNSGGCTCHTGNPPCGYCTHPGNPLNQEDESCWTETVPTVVTTGPHRIMLAGNPSPFGGMVLKGCVDCDYSSRCVEDEAALRHYSGCSPDKLPPMTPEQRDWCLDEIGAVEGHTRTEAIDLPDDQLASAVLQAWGDYARDKGAM